jgi:opacity protein-like surface antigen
MPGLLAFGVRWDAVPVLHLSLGYHHYFDSHADYAGDKEDYLDDSDEFLAGVEWDVTPRWTVGLGGQYTNFGISDEYLSDLSLSLSSWSLGCGAAFRVTDMVRLSASYFMTIYDDWTEESTLGTVKYTDTYDRTSYGFSVGVDLDI